MGTIIRVMAFLIGLGACVAAMAAFYPTGPARRSGNAISLVMEPGEAALVVQQRMKAKTKVVERLVAGELTLVQAAAWFRQLNDTPWEHRCDYRRQWPGNSDGEKLCRQVIAWTRSDLQFRMPESQASALLCQLEGELEMILAERDTVELPW